MLLAKAAPVNPPTKGRWQALVAAFPTLGGVFLPKMGCALCDETVALINRIEPSESQINRFDAAAFLDVVKFHTATPHVMRAERTFW